MKIKNPFKTLSKFELGLWISSLILITVTFVVGAEFDFLVLIASLIGATALIFGASFNSCFCTDIFCDFFQIQLFR